LSGRRLTAEGTILIVARNQRTQEHNRRDAEERLSDLIRRALIPPKARKATRPTRASRQRRLEHKTHQGHTKRLRGRPGRDD
jgi:ribosome-associated protein